MNRPEHEKGHKVPWQQIAEASETIDKKKKCSKGVENANKDWKLPCYSK